MTLGLVDISWPVKATSSLQHENTSEGEKQGKLSPWMSMVKLTLVPMPAQNHGVREQTKQKISALRNMAVSRLSNNIFTIRRSAGGDGERYLSKQKAQNDIYALGLAMRCNI